ncbi:CobW family GTP-binding protein [Primorskyibacter sp. S87]|uniref:CobW family GTP-binding protein n=1 Tax=Primorskyibacter sp. S87 TaxID=3415126 RepID=UPI003C7A207E
MSGDSELPVITIGGYLGSGKTTMINHLLRHANGRRLAVLVNEFGELAIDEDLIEAEDDTLISIAGGCICCSFGNDLIGVLTEMLRLEPRPDYVVVESSGVAIPGAIVSTFSLVEGICPDGIVVVVDAETIMASVEDEYIGDTILRQLTDAEIVVVNKLDLVEEGRLPAVKDWLAELAPSAILVPAQFGKVAPEAILGVVAEPGRGHRLSHSDALFESSVMHSARPVDAEDLARRLADGHLGVIRSKGHVTGADGHKWLIQTVGKRWQAINSGSDAECGVVCIGLRGHLQRDVLAQVFGNI